MSNNQVNQAIQAIDKQCEDVDDEEKIDEIVLDNIFFGSFTDQLQVQLESHPHIASLSLNDCKLSSLENFPKLQKLIRLELIDNKLNGNSIQVIGQISSLQSLSLGGNQIKTFQELKPLTALEELIQLDLVENPITSLPDYTQVVFSMFPKLDILDNRDKDGESIDFSDQDESGIDDLYDDDDDDSDNFDDQSEDALDNNNNNKQRIPQLGQRQNNAREGQESQEDDSNDDELVGDDDDDDLDDDEDDDEDDDGDDGDDNESDLDNGPEQRFKKN